MNQKRRNIIYAVIILFGIVLDLTVLNYESMIKVDYSFIYAVYAAVASIASVGAALLTIAPSTFDINRYGIKVKHLLKYDISTFSVSGIIRVSLYFVLVSTFFLSIQFVNSMVFVLILVCFNMIGSTKSLWELIMDEHSTDQQIIDVMQFAIADNKIALIEEIVDSIFTDLRAVMRTSGIDGIRGHIKIIVSIIHKVNNKKFGKGMLETQLKEAFIVGSQEIGFIPSVENILSLYIELDGSFRTYDIRDIYEIPLKNMRFSEEKEMGKFDIESILKGIESIDFLSEEDSRHILYLCFFSIYDNQIIKPQVKRQILNQYFFHICNFGPEENTKLNNVRQSTILYLLKEFVLINNDKEYAKWIFWKITESIHRRNYFEDRAFYETIALIFLILYLYSEYEVETLKNTQLQFIRDLINYSEDTVNLNTIKFKILIQDNIEKIIVELFNFDRESLRKYNFLEYFSPVENVKTPVWTMEKVITFAFYNYLMFSYRFKLDPIKLIRKLDSFKSDNKIFYCNTLFACSNLQGENEYFLTNETKSRISLISDWINMKTISLDHYYGTIFKLLNNHLGKLELENSSPIIYDPKESESLKDQFTEYMDKELNYFGLTNNIDMATATDFSFKPFIIKATQTSLIQTIFPIIEKYIEGFINQQVKQLLPVLILDFSLKGVNKLLDELRKDVFNLRNYEYIDDLAFSNDIRESERFEELVREIKKVDMIESQPVSHRVFLKKEDFKYNFIITSFNVVKLSDEECSKYVERYKVAEGLYKIEGAYHKKGSAMKLMMNRSLVVNVSFKFLILLTKESGFRIKFDHSIV